MIFYPNMTKGKLQKFAELNTFRNVFQNREKGKVDLVNADGSGVSFKGRWSQECFGNVSPITLELGCGKGEYAIELAKKYPDRNFIGIDIKGARIWRGAKTALDQEIPNVAFIRMEIDHIEDVFGKDEIEETWITFPDPYLKKSKANKRLTSQRFLDIYKKIMVNDGLVNLKTDSEELYDFTKETISVGGHHLVRMIDNIYTEKELQEGLPIQTYYEKMHLLSGRNIKYICFRLNS